MLRVCISSPDNANPTRPDIRLLRRSSTSDIGNVSQILVFRPDIREVSCLGLSLHVIANRTSHVIPRSDFHELPVFAVSSWNLLPRSGLRSSD
jgi:hypothetical protein